MMSESLLSGANRSTAESVPVKSKDTVMSRGNLSPRQHVYWEREEEALIEARNKETLLVSGMRMF